MFIQKFVIFLLSLLASNECSSANAFTASEEENELCYKETKDSCGSNADETRPPAKYLFYDVNASEGFNLRRDVYIRMAILVNKLNSKPGQNWILVLPPWNNLYHWQNKESIDHARLEWSLFFDLESLRKYAPVVELEDLLDSPSGVKIDLVYYLKSDLSDLNVGEFNRFKYLNDSECEAGERYIKDKAGKHRGSFWNYQKLVYAEKLVCLNFRGTNTFLADKILLSQQQNELTNVMIDRAETIVHDDYAGSEFWQCRKSMQYSRRLVEKASQIRSKYLNSNDFMDNIVTDESITPMRDLDRGGPYVAAHIRRADFVQSKSTDDPDLVPIKKIANQIKQVLKLINLNTVFIATDATKSEKDELKKYLEKVKVVIYEPTVQDVHQFKDGGVSIIDQIVCSHARHFIGTKDSTFSYRIQESREIFNFHENTTFNAFCNENTFPCETIKWLMKLNVSQ